MRHTIFLLSICCFTSLITNIISTTIPNDDIAIIRQRVLELMIWPPANATATTIQNALLYTRTLNSSCYWPDIDYHDKNIVLWKTAAHMDRIITMLQALTINGSTVKNDTQMRTAVHCALNVWLTNDWQNPNWWYNQISTPLQSTSQLLMLGDDATSFEIEKIEQISYRANWWANPGDTGANLVWMIQAQLYRSLATNNVTGTEQGFSRMWKDIAVLPLGGQGIENDWSYHFHGQQLLSGAYGAAWASDMFSFILCSNSTQYQPDQEKLEIFTNFLTKGDAWLIVGREWTWQVQGREISRIMYTFGVDFNVQAIRVLSELTESNETRADLLNLADRLAGEPNATLLIGNKHFYTADFQSHRRKDWIATIKMQSIRTQPDECINGENQKAEHTGQGLLNLFTPDANDYHLVFPLFDWQAINGITVEHDIPLENCHGGSFPLKKLAFVGGVSDQMYGLAMMDTASHNLIAKRSWHFYDDAIVALATNLTLTTPTTAWTTLASRLVPTGQITIGFFNSTIISVPDGKYVLPYMANSTSNVQWIHVGGTNIAYLLQLQKQYDSLVIDIGTKTGNYKTIGPFDYTVTRRMLTMSLNHGKGPYTLDYNYMILPNVSLESIPTIIKQYQEEQLFSCMSTNNHFHGIMWPSLKRASFVLWDNTTTTFTCQSPTFQLIIQLTDAGAYLFSETENDFTVTASHPTRINGNVKVVVNRIGSGQGCMTSLDSDASNTDVTLALPSSPELLGASVNVTCKKQTNL